MFNQKHNYLSYVWKKNNSGKSKILFIAFVCFFNFVFSNGKNAGDSGLKNRREHPPRRSGTDFTQKKFLYSDN